MPVHRSLAALVLALISFASLAEQPEAQALGENHGPRGPLATMTLSAPGDELWVTRSLADEGATALEFSPDGSMVFVTGYGYGLTGSGTDYVTIAYDASTGVKQWRRRYEGPGNDTDYARSLAVSFDGSRVFVTGQSIGTSGYDDWATVAYGAATGATLWIRRYNGPRSHLDSAHDLEVSPDGSAVFVTGRSLGTTTDFDYVTRAYDAASGETLWGRRYDRHNETDGANDLAVSPDGSTVFVTGSSGGLVKSEDFVTFAYDAITGDQQWVERYEGPRDSLDSPVALELGPDGSRVFVTGHTLALRTLYPEFATVAYDAATGATLWAPHYNGPRDSKDTPVALRVSPDGSRVFVTGKSSGSAGYFDYETIAYDSLTGASLWNRRYNGPTNLHDVPFDLGVTPDGSTVFVTGESDDRTEYATVAYDSTTGVTLWNRSYDGPINLYNSATALAVSPDGTMVIVTGSSGQAGGGADYATIAYSTS